MLNFKRWPQAVPNTRALYVRIYRDFDGIQYATLHIQHDAALKVPEDALPVPRALGRALAIADQHKVPIYIKLDEGAEWSPAWGGLAD